MALIEEINGTKQDIFTDGYPMSIGELISMYKDGELDIHPEFQRIFRWNIQQKSKLIESILLGIPIPSIFVSQRDDGVWDVVDGLQRLSTIFEFVGILKDENEEILPPSKLIETTYLKSLKDVTWEGDNSLDPSLRLSFKREKIDIKIVKKESDSKVKYELFQRLNTLGSKLSDQEVRNCLLIMLDKDFYLWLKKISENADFINTISIAERLIDEKYHMELALRFLILCNINVDNLKGVSDFSQYITDQMIIMAESNLDRRIWEDKFNLTFNILNIATSENTFKKYNQEKNRFEGKFLVGAFEAVAIGLGKNIDQWTTIDINSSVIESIVEKIKNIWLHADSNRYGAGVNVTTRAPYMIPLGEHFLSHEN